MNKAIIVVSMAILFPLQALAAQLPLQTRANTTSPSVDTNFSRQQLNNTELYTTKADKAQVVRVWADFPDGGDAISIGTPVWYDGKLYNTIQAFVKTAGATPDTFTEYFEVASGSGGVSSYLELTDRPTIPAALSALSDDSTHRLTTDTEKTAWNAKANAAALASADAFQAAFGWAPMTSFNQAGNYSPTGDWNFASANVTGIDLGADYFKVSDAVDLVASAPLAVNPTTGAIYIDTTGATSGQALVFNGSTVGFATIASSGGGPTFLSADPAYPADNSTWFNTTDHSFNVAQTEGVTKIAPAGTTFTAWDLTPTFPAFTDITGAVADGLQGCGTAVTITGINRSIPATLSGDAGYAVKINGGNAQSSGVTVAVNDTVAPCVNRSTSGSTTTTMTAVLGGVSQSFSITTLASGLWTIEDDFSSDTSANYTRIYGTTGTLNISDGTVKNSNTATTHYVHETNLGASAMTVQGVINEHRSSTNPGGSGLVLRSDGVSTGHFCYPDAGSNRFTCEPLGGTGSPMYLSWAADAWAIDAGHLVEIKIDAGGYLSAKIDFNNDGDFTDAQGIADPNEGPYTRSTANTDFAGTYAGFGFRIPNAVLDIVDDFKAKVD